MSEPKLISPMLDNFAMGDPISDRNGVRCCPAMKKNADDRYIVKIISNPASQVQLDALLLSGAYSDKQDALGYFKALADSITEETEILQKLSLLEGFIPFINCQTVPMEENNGYDVYLLSAYQMTLQKYLRNHPMTHLEALNLGLDLCAALTVCRRSGYIYVDLKPNNIYITPERGYRIGDLGFLKLSTLKYASLPERYRSQYTAPEISDAYAALNTTIDIYAAGLILYQVFNNGALPFIGDTPPEEPFAPPAFADYEMAEIILKACAPDPTDRWQDPVDMGQALVSYMQRNGAHDTPITPVAEEEAPVNEDEQVGTFEATDAQPTDTQESPVVQEATGEPADAPSQEAVDPVSEESIYTEDEDGNLTFITNEEDETLPGDEEDDKIPYTDVSEEVSDMLSQADEIIAHPTPDPVVQPEPIDVPIPPLPEAETDPEAQNDKEKQEEPSAEIDTEAAAEPASENTEAPPEPALEENQDEYEEVGMPAERKSHWLRNSLLVLITLAVLALGFLFYQHYYLQPIDAIVLEEDGNGNLTVLVTTTMDEEKLFVVCSDTYGNKHTEPVKGGKAVFADLAPNSAYTIRVESSGFHKLTGDTTVGYTTPVQTNIVQFTAVTGAEDGSIVLSFAIDGPDAEQWYISYTADNNEFTESIFAGHTLTLNGFTIGNEYTFSLRPDSDQRIGGTTEVTYTASRIVKAANLSITDFSEGKLTASWNTPENASVNSWTVRCYNDNGFDNTVVTTEPSASFQVTDTAASYTVEVTAAGMSVSERVFAAANSLLVNNFKVDSVDESALTLSWQLPDNTPQDGWTLTYTADDSAAKALSFYGNSATLSPVVPGAKYVFTLKPADGSAVLGGELTYTAAAAPAFSAYGVSGETMEFKMCRQPSFTGWDRWDVNSSDYRTEFFAGENAAFVIKRTVEYVHTEDKVVTLFVIRDEAGAVVKADATEPEYWYDMWVKGYCELDVPSMPQTPGKYTVEIYFNGALAASVPFTVVS